MFNNKFVSASLALILLVGAVFFVSSTTNAWWIFGDDKAEEAKDDQLTIGVTTVTLRHQFFIDIDEGIKEAAQEKGVEVLVNDPNVNPQKQVAAIEDFMQQDVDGMIVIGTDPSAIVPAVNEAAAKMPVVTVDMQLDTDKVDTLVGTLNKDAGKKLGEYTEDYVQKNLDGETKVAVVTWLQSSIQRQRVEGFEEAFAGTDNVTFLNPQPGYDRQESMSTVENILQSHPDVDIIYATAENSVLGARAALEAANKQGVKIVGFDITSESAAGIKDGTILAMIQQQPDLMGKKALEAVVNKINGKDIKKRIPVPVILRDASNVDEFLAEE